MSKYEIWGLIYAVLAIAVVFQYVVYQEIGSNASRVDSSPVVGRFNASEVVSRRQAEIQTEFEIAMKDNNWTQLKKTDSVIIERMDASDGQWPPYLKTSALLEGTPAEVKALFEWENFHDTQVTIDNFYEGSEVIFDVNPRTRLIRKTSKRPVVYPKRSMTLALVQGEQRRANNMVRQSFGYGYGTLPKGTPTTTMVNVIPTDDVYKASTPPAESGYVRAYQDFVAWYRPRTTRRGDVVEGWTELTIVMRVDMGRDIPHWLFLFMVGVTGVSSMKALAELLAKKRLPEPGGKMDR